MIMIKLKSSFEGEIVKYYDTFFLPQEKVEQDIQYIMKMCDKYLCDNECCIDIGSGTGAYTHSLSRLFTSVIGVDSSHDMIEYANKYHSADNVKYINEDARCMKRIDMNREADFVVSLAHVIGYQLDNKSVECFFKTVNINMKIGGVLLFNFYNMPALFMGHLGPRHVKIQRSNSEITRISNARINPDNNCLDMDYYYLIQANEKIDSFEIHERMRYYSRLELQYYLEKCGFEILKFVCFNSEDELRSDVWNGGVIARKC